MARVARALCLVESRSNGCGAHSAQRRGLGSVGQRGARCSPRRPSGLDRTINAISSTHGIQVFVINFFVTRGVRRARSRHVESRRTAHGARAAQRGLGVLAWLCCRPTRGALFPMPSAGARPHYHRDRSEARHSSGLWRFLQIPWRASRALFVTWKIGQPPAKHAPRSADLAWLCCRRMQGHAAPHAVGRGSTEPTLR